MGIFSTVIKGVLLSPKHIHKYHQANRFKEAVMELSRYHGFQSYYIGNKLDCWEPFSSNIDIESEMFAGLGVDSNTNRRIIVVGGLGQISIKGLFEQNGVQQIATRSNAYIVDISNYLNGGVYQAEISAFEIVREILDKAEKLSELQTI